MNKNLSIIRQLANEIRKTSSHNTAKKSPMMQYILEQARAHQETSETLCKAREELQYLSQNYLCYLQSLEKYQEINNYYSSRGERTVAETAQLVGFKLPHDPY